MRKILSLFSVLMLVSILVFAQTRPITGRVLDEAGQPVGGASVSIKGSTVGTSADVDGAFRINAKTGDVLIISAVGAPAKEVTVTSTSNLTISLAKQTQSLSEVVVTTALGVRKQPRELGYSVSRLGNKELTQASPVNIQNGLTGKVSGLNIASTNSSVFGDTRITLRGIRSLTGNNQPLLVVDGAPVPLNQLSRLNPNDVEDITILKGASAAALYGPDGVNGVIFVKTLRGSKTGAPQVRVSNSTQFERVSFLPKFQKQFGSGSSVDPVTGIGVFDGLENQQYGDPYDGSMREIGHPLPGNIPQMEQYSYKERGRLDFFETGRTIQNDISYSAKNFLFSAQDANISGTLGGDKNRRTTLRFNASNEYGRFSTNFNLSYTRQQFNVASVSPYWEVFNTAGWIDLKKYKDWRNDPASSPNHYYNEYYANPYFIKDANRRTGLNDDLFAQIQLGLKVTDWLNLTYRASTNMRSNDEMFTSEAFTFSDYAHNVTHKYNASNDIKASVSNNETKFNRLNSEVFLTAQKEFGDFSIDGLVGQSLREDRYTSVGISGSNLIIPTLFNVANRTGEPGAGGSNYKSRLLGAYGQVTFGFKKWAFLELTGRNNWDSRLPSNNRSFFFPGANASIVLSDAIPAIKNSSLISYLKVRGSIVKSGNVNLSGNQDPVFGAYQLESVYGVAAGFPYGNLPGFQGSTAVNNPDIKPEFVNSKEAGFEISILKNKVNLEVTGYLQNNTNQIINVNVSRATGVGSTTVNAADFDNKGLEFDLRLTPLVNLGDFRVNFNANLSLMDSRVNSVYQGLNELPVGNSNYAIVGYPAFMFKLTDYVRDPQGRIIVDRNTGYPSLDPNLKTFGNTMPKTILGLVPSIAWKGLTLNVTADYRGGHQVYNAIGSDMDFTGSSARSGSNNRQRFVVPNSVYDDGSGKYIENTSILTTNGGYGFYEGTNTNRGINTNYLTSAAAFKIREISLIYSLPTSFIQGAKFLKSATIGLTARNMFTFLPKSNQWTDPEFNTSTGNGLGVNTTANLPPNRLYGFNAVLVF
ncbi:SusC/RagA family TonB-linked outer membrane protein [Segetibacter aerophilus]|nr:SusC/RagA family TonB-linked outer membrane protein [Segetibacter aerophilus]